MNPSSLFIRRPIMTVLVMIAFLFFGTVAYKTLPISDLPSIDYPAITVQVDYPGASPETIANNVVAPLERQFLTIGGLQSMASTSTTGSATIVLQFSLSTTIDTAAVDVQAAINEANPLLPQDLPYAPTYSKVNPSTTPILYFVLSSSTMPIYDLYDYAYTFIGERISTVSGVAQVIVYGTPYAVRVRVDPQKLAAKGIGIDEVAQAVKLGNVDYPTGSLYGPTKEYTLDVHGKLPKAAVYDSLIIKSDPSGQIVRLRDVGYALDSLSNNRQEMRYLSADQESTCVVFAVQTQPGVNTMTVIHDIDQILPQVEKNLPGSLSLYRLFDKAEYIGEAVADVQMTLLIALALVVFIIFVYLGRGITTLIPALALPISIMGTFAVMSIFGYSVDILSLLALTLSIGFLVDDAIVVLENIFRHIEMGKPPLEAALTGSREIGFTIVSMTLSLSSVFIPLLFLGGLMGQLFHEFAVVIVSAMVISGFVSLSLTPVLCHRFIPTTHAAKGPILRFSEAFQKAITRLYAKTLTPALAHRGFVLLAAAASVAGTVFLFLTLPSDFIPQDDIGFITVHTQGQDGTSYSQMNTYQQELSRIARANPHVESVVSLTGMPSDNKGAIFLRLKPLHDRPPLSQVLRTVEHEFRQVIGVQAFLKAFPLIDLQVSTTDINAPYQYTLQSLDEEALFQSTDAMMNLLKTTPGFKQVSTDLEIHKPQLSVEILRDRASTLNISAAAIENAFSYAFASTNLSPINQPDNLYYAILEVEPKFALDPSLLSQLYIRSSTGGLVPLSAITRQTTTVGPLSINRMSGLPATNIFFDLDGMPLGSAIKKIDGLARHHLPPNVIGNVQGTAGVFEESFASLSLLLLIALFVVYTILGILYENFLHPVTIMSTLPPAALGGLLTLLLFREPLSIYAMVGLILLLGIVMKNGIILIDFATTARQEGKSPLEAIHSAALARLRPILMTTFSAMMGAVPIALGLGGMTMQSRRPLGLVIVGGLLFSQILTLYFTPALYLALESLREKISGGTPKMPEAGGSG